MTDKLDRLVAEARRAADKRAEGYREKALVLFFPGPNSTTGEDVVEFQVHGNPLLVRRLLEHLGRRGIRLAEPGESVPEGKSLEGQIENYSFLGRMIRYWVRVGEEQFIIDDANVDLSGARSGAVQLCLDTRKLHILKDGGSHDT